MRILMFSSRPYDLKFFGEANGQHGHDINYLEARLTADTVVLAHGYPAVCAFVNDRLDADVLEALYKGGTRIIALRSAGFNHVDRQAAARLGLVVSHVPAYSPGGVADHTLALILALNRKIHRAYARVRDGNFSLDGLLGFDMAGRTAGVVGTGKIGLEVIRRLAACGCKVLAHDPFPNDAAVELGARYVDLAELFRESHIVTLHCPLTPETHHLVNHTTLGQMRDEVMIINTGRGALVDTEAVIAGLKTGKIGYLGLDVYEEEADLFFEDFSDRVIHDDVFSRLLTFPNVLITGHQGFFTEEALWTIASTTLESVTAWEKGTGDLHLIPGLD